VLATPLCRQLGIAHPIFSVGMGAAAGPELTAAVSSARGLGVMGASRTAPKNLPALLERVRTLTDEPFGVNLIIAVMHPGLVDACFEARVPLVVFFWGDPAPYMKDAHARGVKVFVQVPNEAAPAPGRGPAADACYFSASIPAWAICASCCDVTPDTPTLPTILPSTTMGMPPSSTL
jgi:NAD(P)H-dependent flavin oxidoreductase YrpB (nitropropane dioxygenase family)